MRHRRHVASIAAASHFDLAAQPVENDHGKPAVRKIQPLRPGQWRKGRRLALTGVAVAGSAPAKILSLSRRQIHRRLGFGATATHKGGGEKQCADAIPSGHTMMFTIDGLHFNFFLVGLHMTIQRVTVYAASSQAVADKYKSAAARLGASLAQAGISIYYGGGSRGLMGAMADAAMAANGRVYGIIPEFLTEVEKGHQGITRLDVVPDMHTRKARMLARSEAVIALPGGCGTFEELFEVMTLKRLGQFLGPIILINTDGYYNRLLAFLAQSVEEKFMGQTHLDLWQTVAEPEQIHDALADAPEWSSQRLLEAAVGGPNPV